MSQIKPKARGTAVKYGVYEFSDSELQKKGVDLANHHRKKRELEQKLKDIKSEYKNKQDKIDTEIERDANDLSTGTRDGDFECLVYLDLRNDQWHKVYESKEYGHEVAVELFDYEKDAHLFDFTTKRDDDNGVKKILWEGEEIMTLPYTAAERQLSIKGTDDEESQATLKKYQEKHNNGKSEDYEEDHDEEE